MVCAAAAAASPGCSWEMQSLRGHPRCPQLDEAERDHQVNHIKVKSERHSSTPPRYKILLLLQVFSDQDINSESHSVMSNSLRPHELYSPWNSPGQNAGVGSLSILQGIFPTQDQTQVSHIAGGFFTSWATREAQTLAQVLLKKGLNGQNEFWRHRLLYSPFLKLKSAPKQIKNVQEFLESFPGGSAVNAAHQPIQET